MWFNTIHIPICFRCPSWHCNNKTKEECQQTRYNTMLFHNIKHLTQNIIAKNLLNSPLAGWKWLTNVNEHSHRPEAVYLSCCLRPINNRRRNYQRQEPYYTSYDFYSILRLYASAKGSNTACTILQSEPIAGKFCITPTL